MVFRRYLFIFQTIKKTDHYEFNCQHGPKECYGNMLHTCAIAEMGYSDGFKFIYCLMSHNSNDEFADKVTFKIQLIFILVLMRQYL